MGVLLGSRRVKGRAGQAQVSMNLTDLGQTGVAEAYRAVEREAAKLGIAIQSSEIIGLVPEKTLAGVKPEEIKLADFSPEKILENRLAAMLNNRGLEQS